MDLVLYSHAYNITFIELNLYILAHLQDKFNLRTNTTTLEMKQILIPFKMLILNKMKILISKKL